MTEPLQNAPVMSIQELRARVQHKNLPGNPYLQRWPSLYITYLLIQTPLTPNFVTASMFLAGIAGAVAVGFGYFWLGFALMYANLLLDMCDGEVARYKNVRTLNGGYLDLVNHLVTQSLFFLALTYQAAGLPQSADTPLLIVGVLGALSMSVRRSNGDLHRVLFVRKVVKRPELFTAAASRTPAVPESAISEQVTSSHFLSRVAWALYEMHELLYLTIIFALAYAAESLWPLAPGHPVLYWLVLFYGITSCLYLFREVYGGFVSIEDRVYSLGGRILYRHPHDRHS